MPERGKISRYRRALRDAADPAAGEAARRASEGEAASLGLEIHGEERAGKPRALTRDTELPRPHPVRDPAARRRQKPHS